MCWIAERTRIGVVRRHDNDPAARRKYPVELFHTADDITDMFDDVNRANLPKAAASKWKRETIQIGNHIRARVGVAIQADCPWILIHPAADIQNRQCAYNSSLGEISRNCCSYCSRMRRHCSMVSMAKSACSSVITSGGHSRILFAPAPKISKPRSNASISRRSRRAGARSLVA